MRDLHNDFEIRRLISPTRVTGNAAEVSQIIDLANRDGVELVIAIGTLADAAGATFTALVEDGDDSALSDNAAVADAYLLGTEAGASFILTSDDEVRKIGYIGPKRYLRLTITSADNSGDSDFSAIAILGHGRVKPHSSQS